MKLILVVLTILALTWAVPRKNVKAGDIEGRLIGGHEAAPGEIPYQAAVFFTTSAGEALCGGTLIENDYVLTAAHCTQGATQFRIQLGSNTLNDADPNRVTILAKPEDVTVHPEYKHPTAIHDLALIHLPEPVATNEFIQPIALYRDSLSDMGGDTLVMSGWGRTSDLNDFNSNILKVGKVHTLDFLECAMNTDGLQIGDPSNGNVCTSGSGGYLSPCTGDSGGPLTIDGELAAIITYVNIWGCNDPVHYAAHAQISAHTNWIEEVVG